LKKVHLYFRLPPKENRFIWGDKYLFTLAGKLFRKKKISGIGKVFDNLREGFDELKVDYDVNFPFNRVKPDEPVVVLGWGKYALEGYDIPNPVIAGIGLMTHPNEWPDLFKEYPVAKYLQHSEWTQNIYARFYGEDNCALWPCGIDTQKWAPVTGVPKKYDVLVYNKIMWDKEKTDRDLKQPILQTLAGMGFTAHEIIYGNYAENEYYEALLNCRAMLFLCEHESQGFACCEALAMNVPVFAWDQGYWLDENRFVWNDLVVEATSVPYFDARCGMTFKDLEGFKNGIGEFWKKVGNGDFNPREYILENLTLKKSAQRMLDIISGVYK